MSAHSIPPCAGCTGASEASAVTEGSGRRGGLKLSWPDTLELGHLSPREQRDRLRRERIGVLIDLDGWIGDEPPRVLLALNPTPVRGQWLGWAGTTGDAAMHYMVSDRITSPTRLRALYCERLVLLPRAYQLNDHYQLYAHVLNPASSPAQPGGAANLTSEDADGVDRLRGGFTFANFNQLMKLSPDIFGVWSNAMLRTPRSQLLLVTHVTNVHVSYPFAGRNLRAEMAVGGLATDRLLHGPVRPKSRHLVRAAACDLAVDTLSYNSHTTGSDALWSGLPMLTQSGRYFSARVGGSLTTHAGTPHTRVSSLRALEDSMALLAAPRERIDASLQLSGLPDPAIASRHRHKFGTFAMPWGVGQLDSLLGPRPWRGGAHAGSYDDPRTFPASLPQAPTRISRGPRAL